ncbi:hypothetical protein GR925_27575 [Streptomyces sp. HUCO-GS316]|uniref:hypothetical protein n=1 Tax=Streptomyces sp. HUCO-GS316 TaxID=2692198 RepID=UPI00136D8171|nr:hypothetical protein [Streptomyces sp. HUCO-GS316]MXM67087.1 hypothetical protein [Streptomyces sp. HUCO-GS316]
MSADDLDELTRRIFADRDPVAELLEARRAAAAAPPEPCIIPMPEFPPRRPGALFGGPIRYRCTVPGGGCPWAYELDPYAADLGPLVFPLSGSLEELDRAITEQAERRGREVREGIEGALREHFAREHPGQEPPDLHAVGESAAAGRGARLP